jgi:hypothetical protein
MVITLRARIWADRKVQHFMQPAMRKSNEAIAGRFLCCEKSVECFLLILKQRPHMNFSGNIICLVKKLVRLGSQINLFKKTSIELKITFNQEE